ncbi:MAG: polysaccharide biosynthesis protein [Balneolaceae bacterium]
MAWTSFLVSTDKAVNPTNVMGATKRIAEQICMSFNGRCETSFISVRFGNVLGFRGSVVPLFIEQINAGGPVTITDPKMTRYFMTIPEAVLLVIQSGTMGDGGEVFVLDTGEPVRIIDMARQLIRLHGLEPEVDIPIVFNGLCPGEKMYEELLNAEEGVLETGHTQIFKANCMNLYTSEELEYKIDRLCKTARLHETGRIREQLKGLVPTYIYSEEPAVVSGNVHAHAGNGFENGHGANGNGHVNGNGTIGRRMNGGGNGHLNGNGSRHTRENLESSLD